MPVGTLFVAARDVNSDRPALDLRTFSSLLLRFRTRRWPPRRFLRELLALRKAALDHAHDRRHIVERARMGVAAQCGHVEDKDLFLSELALVRLFLRIDVTQPSCPAPYRFRDLQG